MPNKFEVFMDTLRKYKPIHMSALFKDNDEIKTITFTEKDITSIVNDFDNDTMNKLIENKPEKRVFIENLQEFLDPDTCSEHWDELAELFKDDEDSLAMFNSMFNYYCGVYDTFKSINNYQDTFYEFGELTKCYYPKNRKIIVTVDGPDCQDIDELNLIFEVYINE